MPGGDIVDTREDTGYGKEDAAGVDLISRDLPRIFTVLLGRAATMISVVRITSSNSRTRMIAISAEMTTSTASAQLTSFKVLVSHALHEGRTFLLNEDALATFLSCLDGAKLLIYSRHSSTVARLQILADTAKPVVTARS